MRLQKVQDALNKKNNQIRIHRGRWLRKSGFHVPWTEIPCMGIRGQRWGAETNVFAAGRSEDVEGDYEEIISREILSWPDMITPN